VVGVTANLASVDDALAAVRNGADAVGLLRSEFLLLDRHDPPTEDEQVAAFGAGCCRFEPCPPSYKSPAR
jgi:multiphosphoryl transfer protein